MNIISTKRMNEMNNSSLTSNQFLRDCIDLAIDGFLFRGITPSDHYYRFTQSFPKAFTLLSQSSSNNYSNSSTTATPKKSHRHHSSSSSTSTTLKQQQRGTNSTTTTVPPLDLSSLNSNVLLEQQPVSTIMSINNNPSGLTIKTKKPVYSPKDSASSSSTTDRRLGNVRRPNSATKTPLVTSNSPNTPLSSTDPSPSSKRNVTGQSPSTTNDHSSDEFLHQLEVEAREIQERMMKHRLKHSRTPDLSQMTSKEILDEKCDMQQELLRFENKYSKPTTSEEKRIMKPLYDYYRQLKRLVEKQQPIH